MTSSTVQGVEAWKPHQRLGSEDMVLHTFVVDSFDPATSWLQAKRQLAAGLAALWGVSPEQAHYHLELAKPQLLPAAGQVAVGRAGLPVVDSQQAQTAAQVSKLDLTGAVLTFTTLLLKMACCSHPDACGLLIPRVAPSMAELSSSGPQLAAPKGLQLGGAYHADGSACSCSHLASLRLRQ